MIFYGDFQTICGLGETPVIDYIEFEFDDKRINPEFIPDDLKGGSGIRLCCSWDMSDWSYDQEDGSGSFRCKGVMAGEKYANGALDMFKGSRITDMQVYFADKPDGIEEHFEITSFEIWDNDAFVSLEPCQFDKKHMSIEIESDY